MYSSRSKVLRVGSQVHTCLHSCDSKIPIVEIELLGHMKFSHDKVTFRLWLNPHC